MKREVILLLFLVVCMPISHAEVIDIPGISPGGVEEVPEPLRDGLGVKKFVYAGDNILASVEDSEVEYFHQGRMSNRVVTDSSGNSNKEFKSLPFGQKIENSGVDYPFTGKEEDESSLYYFGARYYDDSLGRFTSVDPVKENHPYSYVANNPMNRIDPSGMNDEGLIETHTVKAGQWTWGHVLPKTRYGRTVKSYEETQALNPDLNLETLHPGDVVRYYSASSDPISFLPNLNDYDKYIHLGVNPSERDGMGPQTLVMERETYYGLVEEVKEYILKNSFDEWVLRSGPGLSAGVHGHFGGDETTMRVLTRNAVVELLDEGSLDYGYNYRGENRYFLSGDDRLQMKRAVKHSRFNWWPFGSQEPDSVRYRDGLYDPQRYNSRLPEDTDPLPQRVQKGIEEHGFEF